MDGSAMTSVLSESGDFRVQGSDEDAGSGLSGTKNFFLFPVLSESAGSGLSETKNGL